MNKARRNEIARAQALLADAQQILYAVADEESDAYDNLPESIQSSELGEKMNEYAARLRGMASACGEAADEDFSE